MKVQIAYKYSNVEGEFRGYDIMDYGGSFFLKKTLKMMQLALQ